MNDDLLTTREAAKMLRITPESMRRWRSQGTGPRYTRTSARGPVRYRRSDLDAYLAQREVTTTR